MLRSVLILALAALTVPAAAEMYRYRDPHTGQMKLTNVPPPRTKPGAPAPAVATPGGASPPAPATVPPSGGAAPAKPAATLPPHAFEMDRQRTRLLQQLVAEAPNVGTPAGKERFFARLGDVVSIEARLDKIDSGGRKARAAERDRALEQCSDGFATALKDSNAQLEFTGELLRFMGDRVVQCARGPC
jgi:Domain of unknown function (DUF4124)